MDPFNTTGNAISTLRDIIRKRKPVGWWTIRAIHVLILISLLLPYPLITNAQVGLTKLDIRDHLENNRILDDSIYRDPQISRPKPRVEEQPSPIVAEDIHSSPVMFVENVGQFEDEALFQVRGAEGAIHLTSDGFWLTLMEEPPALSPEDGQTAGILTAPETSLRGVHLRLSFPSANPQPKVMGFDPIDTTISYFRGNDPAQWHSGVPVWRGVRYIDLYPGVDLEMTSEAGAWSWQFVTSEQSLELIEGSLPRGNAADGREAAGLRLQIEGSEGLTIDAGRVHIANAILQIALPLPDLIRAGNLTSLINKVGTVLEGEEVFLPLIDLSTQPEPILTASERPMAEPPQLDKPAVIPEDTAIPVSASTLGGGGGFQAQVTPFTDPEIRNAAGLRDVRLNGIDDLLYSTFLGDNEHDNGNDVEFGEDGTMFLVGTTRNWDFPIIPGAVDIIFQGNNEAFVSKVDPTAFGSPSLVYSTFLGGEISDAGYGIAVSPSGDGTVYIVGNTSSSDFPTTEGAFSETLKGLDDIFVARLAAGGDELLYSTYLGGTNDEVGRPDWGFGIAVDPEGSGIAYVTGSTFATDFPTLGAYQDEYGGGVSDGYVTALNSTGTELVYSTYLGGASSEEIRGIAMSPGGGGDVFLTGRYAGPDFPTTIGAFRTTHTSQYGEAFAVRLNAAGNDLVYSTFLGGSYKTEAYSIAVDSLDNAYITGQTWSDDFPITFGAYQTALLGPFDAFVFKLNPGGTAPVWSTYLGGGPGYTVGDHVERGYDIIVDVNGFPTVTGHSTSGATFPTTTGAFSTSGQIFLTRMTSDGAELSYSAVFGAIDYGYGVGQRPDGSGVVAVTGVTWGGIPITSNAYDTTYNGGGDAFVSVVDMGFTGSAIPDNAVHSGCGDDTDGRGCAVANASNATGEAVDPINTRTGGLDYPVVDISLPTIAGLLVFQRSYASLATDMYTTLLGYGWSHNHETRLVFPDDPGGEAGKVIFKAHSANQYEIIDNGDGTYSAGPGVLVTLTLDSGPPPTYTLTDFTQNTYLFDEDGKLLTWTNASGHSWSYTYDASDRLDIVVDDTSGRYLDLAYDLQERLESVSDNTGREVSFTYDGNGDLTNVNDVEGENWTYVYDTAHRLTDVIDPRLVPVMHTDYDAEGRAYQQFDGEGNRQALITYNPDGTTSIEDALTNIEVHTYDARNTLTSETDALGNDLGKNYDYHFRPSTITDKNENPVTLLWSTDGANLEQVVDAVGNDVNMDYDVLNNLTQIVDARDFPTDFEYVGAQLTKVIDPYLKETIYTYTTVADAPQPIGLLKTIRDPNLNVTEYEYDAEGNLIHITDEIPGDTTYTYDALGRLQTTTDRLGIVDWTCYDSAGRLTRTVSNASGDGGSPQTDPCDAASYIPSSAPDVDRITSIVYDEVGNPLASIDPAGTITRTYYDDNNRPAVVVQNLVGQTIENPTPPTYNPSNPDKNIRTEIVYDVAGNPIATIDTLGRITRTYYDELNRPQYVVENLVGQGISVTTPPAYNPIYPDQNIRSETVYDDNSNVIASINTLGRITRTYYNSLNQVEYVVGNLVGQAISVPTPPSYSPSNPDQNIRTEYIYDVSGNTIASIDTLGQITRTYYDALNRPESIVQNLTGQAISVETPPAYDPNYPDQNVRTEYVYDDAGNTIATADPLGRITRSYYDDGNRLVFEVRNLVGQGIGVETPPTYNPAFPDENVRTEYVYDDAGNTIATIDTLGVITRTYYDDLGRTRYVVENLTGQGISVETPPTYNPSNPDQNVRTEYVYDDAGQQIAAINTLGQVTRTYYDDLGRTRFVVENLTGQSIPSPNPPVFNPDYPDENIRTEHVYDGNGNLIQTIDSIGKVAFNCYDGAYRIERAVENPTIGDPCGSYTPSSEPDHDVITDTEYDGLGNAIKIIDPNGDATDYVYDDLNRLITEIDPLLHSTQYQYNGLGNKTGMIDAENVETQYEFDALGRLVAVIENYQSGITPDHETNVRTEYTYDGAGNLKKIHDGNGHDTTFGHDDLNRTIWEKDALLHTTSYVYDGLGNRKSLTDANNQTTAFGYDDLNRLTSINYPDPDPDVSFTYDGLGNRKTMIDGAGTTEWFHDGLSRVTSVNDPFSDTTIYTYDAVGNRKSIQYPSTVSVLYDLDALGRIKTVTDWDLQDTSYTYDKVGRILTVSLPNGISSDYTFDNAGRLDYMEHGDGIAVLSSFDYTYDNVGNRIQVVEFVEAPPTPTATNTPTPTSTPTATESPSNIIGEVGQVVDLDHNPQTVILSRIYTDPVVIARPASINESDPSLVRITDVQADRFTFYIDEAPDMDGTHGSVEVVSYLVLETGDWELADGTLLEAGKVTTTASVGKLISNQWETVTLSAGFTSAPAVFSQVQSENDASFVGTRQQNASAGSFDVAMEEEEASTAPHGSETIGWVAIEAASGTWSGHSYQSGVTPDSVAHRWYTIDFSPAFSTAPRFIAALYTYDEDDSSHLRYQDLGASSVEVQVEEDTTYDSEMRHTKEMVSWLAIEGDGTLEGTAAITPTPTPTATNTPTPTSTPTATESPSNIIGEVGQVVDLDHNPQTVILSRIYTDPVVIARPASINESDPSLVRITDVQADRFTFYIDEAPDMDGTHGSVEVVSYLVLETGDWELADGTLLEAGKVTTTASVGKLISNQWETVTLSAGFTSAPAVFSQVQSENDASFVGTRQQNASAGSFDVAMEEEEASTAPHGSETIGWVAIEAASGTWSGHSYQSGVTPDSVAHRWYTIDFSPAFSTAPRFIAALYTYDEDDSSHLRYQDLGASSVEVQVEEDTTYDSEMRHTKEMVSWLAIEGDGTLEATYIGTGYHPVEPSTRFAAAADTEEQKSILGWLGSMIQVIMRPWRDPSSYLANQPLQQASPTASASSTGTPLSPTATVIPATATATSSEVPIVSPTPTLEITTTPSVEPSPSESGMEAMDLSLFETLSFGEPVTITYDYDPLYRLTAADYDTGEFFHYTYDAVGNRLTQDTHEASNTYLYDDANRLIDVDGVTLTWDDNGNLLSDGVSTYTYDRTNRLSSVIQGTDTYSYTYNGLGDRLTQTVNSVPTSYTLDLAGGLKQVLSDGTNDYLYGVNRIGELQPGGWQYHLPDALGSVRQLVDWSGTLAQARGFEPFGDELEASSITTSVYGFASEWGDATGLTYLRARYYDTTQGRFLSRDVWEGDVNKPITFNAWLYAFANTVNLRDPSGQWPCENPWGNCGNVIPDVVNFNPGIEPKGIDNWRPAVHVNLASSLFEGDEKSQFNVRDPSNPSRTFDEGNPTGEDPHKGWYLCGQISLSMILETVNPSLKHTLIYIWDVGTKKSGEATGAPELYEAVGNTFPSAQEWIVLDHAYGRTTVYGAKEQSVTDYTSYPGAQWHSKSGLYGTLKAMLEANHYVIQLVTHEGGILRSSIGDGSSGHWVVLTGFSDPWSNLDASPWNWVRINNPYRNRIEYYPWENYKNSLIGNRTLEMWPSRKDYKPPHQ